MGDIKISTEIFVLMGVESILMTALAVIIAFVWKKKTKEPLKPIIVGAVTFMLFAIVLKAVPAILLLQLDSPVSRAINGSLLLTYATAGILAGVFEETGRFLAFKTVLKKSVNRQTAITYGIGHGGMECLYIAFNVISMIAICIVVNEQGVEAIANGMSAAQIAAMTEQLKSFSNINAVTVLLAVLERCGAVILHIALSIIVFSAVHDKKRWFLYPAAVLIHALVDFSIILSKYGIDTLWFELLFLVLSAGLLAGAYKLIYKKIQSPIENAEQSLLKGEQS